MITDAELDELRDRYEEKSPPTCRLCGAPMSVARSDFAGTEWRCAGDTVEGGRRVYAAGRAFADEHYSASRQYRARPDERVVALIDAYVALREKS